MLKKFLVTAVLAFSLVFSLTSCFAFPFSQNATVSEEEWRDAFDLSNVDRMRIEFSFTTDDNYKYEGDTERWVMAGTVTYSNNVLKAKYTETLYEKSNSDVWEEDNEYEEEWEEEYDVLTFSCIEEIGIDLVAQEICSLYEEFEYSRENNAYNYAMDYRGYGILYVSVWFDNGNITRISFSGDLEDDSLTESVRANYNFTY